MGEGNKLDDLVDDFDIWQLTEWAYSAFNNSLLNDRGSRNVYWYELKPYEKLAWKAAIEVTIHSLKEIENGN